MDTRTARVEICRIGRSLFERGYVHASSGNLSVRLRDGVMITPTDACLGFLQPQRLSFVDAEGTHRAGDRPSKTVELHRRLYRAAPEAGCIVHTHSTHLVALTLQGVWRTDAVLPPITPYFVMKVGAVPLIAYHRPGDPAVADDIARAIAAQPQIRAVLLDRLGPVVWHRTPADAMAALEELEETAKLWLLGGRRATPLSRAQIAELQAHFGPAAR
jgi:ribulose-5-phosphate 4-epimerase/fuculose-1-phosphate aldolase